MATGRRPSRVSKRILLNMDRFVESLGLGEAFGDSLGYKIDPPLPSGRQSFCPDVSYYFGPLPTNEMAFIDGPPNFAVEVRSENDYGSAGDRAYADKRRDYFFAGTQVVWDVDPVAETITVYRQPDPTTAAVFRKGDVADAEPTLPGWRLKVDDIFA